MIRAERGVAIIMAIFIVALAASVAAAISWQQQLRVRAAERLGDLAQAQIIARSALSWAQYVLYADQQAGQIDHAQEEWAQTDTPLPAEKGEVRLSIADQQGLFNLNNLVNTTDIQIFQRLLQTLGLPADLANAAADWVDADDQARFPGGAEDMDYLSATPAYRAANQPYTEVGNLLAVKGFDKNIVEKLRAFVVALPLPTSVNLNTAPPQLLVALFQDLSLAQATAFKRDHKNKAFSSESDFTLALQKVAYPGVRLGVQSNYFLARAEVQMGTVRTKYSALVARRESHKPKLLWQAPQ